MKDTNDILSRIIVRDYRPDDYVPMMALWDLTGLGGAHRGDTSAVIETSIAMGGRLLVAEDAESTLLATSWMTFDGRRLHLHHLGVLPAYQRKGIGRLLSRHCIEYAIERNVQIKLEVHRTNKAAIALYQQLGFNYLGDYDVYIIRKFS
ncbi:MAG: GNAT family N-acetyltransferase [Bacteroidales bacterium]|nr:GNAT family N-acetyltransferase [Bacteroidales bacterium]